MRKLLKILTLLALPGFAAAQCDTTGILLELQATTNLQGIIFGDNRCLTTLTIGSGLTLSNDTLSSSGGAGTTDLSYSIGGSPVTLFSSTGTDVGIIAGTGIGLSSTATDLTITNSAPSLWTDAGVYTYLTSTTDRAVVGSATELNTSYIMQAKGGLFVQGAGSTSGTYAGVFEKADGTDILNIRNDGRVGINNSGPAYALDIVGDIGQDQPSAIYNGTTPMLRGKPANHNYFFGGAGNTTGNATKNIAIGTSALLNLGATGGFNVAIGFEAGKLITTGQGNVAIGDEALKTNATGNNNFALGKDALELATESANVAIGGLSMAQTTTGAGNVAVGYYALNANTIGGSNVGIGSSAMQNNTDGVSNVAIGESAMNSNSTGDRNVSVGRESLYSSTGDDNTALGRQAGVNLTSGNRNILIGARIHAPVSTGSNQISIGNIIYATGADGDGTTVSSGSVGIKTNAPSQALHVAGNLRVTGAVYDSNNDPGTAGQVMSSTATGTDWVAAATSYTDEQAQDAVGTILVDSPQIDFTYNDATPSITATVIDESITYAKIQNVAANNVLLGNDSGAGADVQELSTAEVQTMLGYIDGAGANQRIAYFTDANTLAAEAAFIYDAVNDRQTITAATPGLGAGAAILNLTNTGPDGTGEFLQIRGDISVNLLSGMTNTNTGSTANTIWNVTQSGNSAGDAYIQTQISGTGGNTTSFGLDNSDANKFKITPNGNSPGVNANASLVATNDAIPLWGVNKDAPAFPLDVGGKDRSEQYHGINVAWATGDFFFGLGAGTSPTFTAMSGTHNFVKVEFSTGTSPTANNAIFSIVRKAGYEFSTKAFPVFCAGNANAAGEIAKFYMSSDDGVTMTMTANGTLTASTAYVFYIGFSGY